MALLKDLCASEKAKVSRLIQQIVEQGQQIQTLQQQHSQAKKLLEEALDSQRQLQEQNASVARDNTSLKAKLTHAFSLIKTYQHKVRGMQAVVQASQARCGGDASDGSGCWVEQEGPGRELQDSDWTSAEDFSEASQGQQPFGKLSPIREASREGPSPSPRSAQRTASSASSWSAHAAGAAYGAPLPQQRLLQQHLEPLTLLARALLEAQAEMMLGTGCNRQQQGGALHCLLSARQQQVQAQPAATCSSEVAVQAGPGAGCSSAVFSGQQDEGGCSVDAGGKENSPLRNSYEGPRGSPGNKAQPAQCGQQFLVSSSSASSGVCCSYAPPVGRAQEGGASQHHQAPSPAASLPASSQAAPAMQPPAATQQPLHLEQPSRRQAAARASSSSVLLDQFDPLLLDILAEVEGMQLGSRSNFSWGAIAPEAPGGGGWQGSSQRGGGRAAAGGSTSVAGGGGSYEESDILSIIAALE